ncbi:MAG: DUF1801 domain-containing protein [Gammaproteobacteria bacterium]|nr:DUF1801 domain-containing protein [Gammaproteobacteria bacterium]
MTFDNYLEKIPEDRAERFTKLVKLIMGLYPDAKPSMKYKMPTFTMGTSWVALANQKSYISLYTCSAEHLKEFKMKYPDVKTGKACVNIKDKDDFPLRDLASVISSAMEMKHN